MVDPNHLDDRPHTVHGCLLALGVTHDMLSDCETIHDEFKIIKTLYRVKILEEHPDRGGDPAVFRKTNAAFYVIRDLKNEGNITTFVTTPSSGDKSGGIDDMYDGFWEQFSKGSTPSYEYYEEMAQEEMPGYKVELAKSGRSKCEACKKGQSKPARLTGGGATKRSNRGDDNPVNDAPVSTATATALVAVPNSPRRSTRTKKKLDTCAMTVIDQKTNDPHLIPQGNIRIGSLDDQSGTYGRWHHLGCWRVPYLIWAGMMDLTDPQQVKQDLLLLEDVLFDGVSDLPENELVLLIEHIMDKNKRVPKHKTKKGIPNLEKLRRNAEAVKSSAASKKALAKNVGRDSHGDDQNDDGNDVDEEKKPAAEKRKAAEPDVVLPDESIDASAAPKKKAKGKKAVKDEDGDNHNAGRGDTAGTTPSSNALVVKDQKKKLKFNIPRPGINGARAGVYEGKRFVLTGVFPEVGGGVGLNLGKDRVKQMIESFGGKVTGSVSGKTNFLVVGKQPGQSKVLQATKKEIPLIDLKSLNDCILGTLPALEQAEAPAIRSFSAGYQTKRIMY